MKKKRKPPSAKKSMAPQKKATKADANAPPEASLELAHEAMRHILGPAESPDGAKIDATAERARQRAAMIEVLRAAEELGLRANAHLTYAPVFRQTERARDVNAIARPQMQEAADEIIVSRTKLRIRKPDGGLIELVNTEIRTRNQIRACLSGIAKLLAAPFKFAASISIKVGAWAQAKIAGKTDAE